MNPKAQKIMAISLCTALCLGGVGMALPRTTTGQQEPPQTQKLSSTLPQTTAQDISKDETVYVLAGSDGSVKKIIVSDWIQNATRCDTLSDKSDLRDIENVKGEESYTLDSDNMTVWDAQGNDIYYQGNIEKELPVDMTLTYFLNGQVVSAQELVGQSGTVTIRFTYENRQYEMVEIDGKEEKIYVPFTMLTGMMLDNDTFRNVTVNNGKLINDGDRTIVVGLAFPGLQETLALNPETLDIPDFVEITADVTDFSFGMTVTLATNELFSQMDATKLDSLDENADAFTELTDAMTQLMDGSSALYDGLCTLLDKSNELTAGIDQLAEGAKALRDGANTVNNGTVELESGAAELSSGLNSLSANSETLNAGAAQVFNTLLSTATTQIRAAGISIPDLTISNYNEVFTSLLSSLGSDAAAMSDEDYQTAVAAGLLSPEQQSAITAAKTLGSLKSSLDSYQAFYTGLTTYTGGVDSAAAGAAALSSGAAALKEGTAQLNTGAASLYDGVLTMKNGTPALVDGIQQLKDGAMELSEGLQQFNEQGIQKLMELVEGDLANTITRLKASIAVSQRYQNFAGISDEMDGQVKFIYRTDEVQ